MPSLNLKSDGPVAKYLGFIVGEPTYKPSNFCSLFWMLLFSPLIFIFCRIVAAWSFFKDKIDTAIENSTKRQAAQLAIRYKTYPDEALIDWYQHYSRWRWDIQRRNKIRDADLVERAFQILGKKFNESYWLEILVKIGATTETNENAISNRYFELIKPTPDQTKTRDIWRFWCLPLGLYSAFAVCFLPIALVAPEGAFLFCIISTGVLVGCLFYRLELNIVVYNVYRAIKDKTCPLIVWD
jgi:hypothetical protein